MRLIVVGLPLGNINDISLRAIETLKNASLVVCEDTRVFYKLWQVLLNRGILDRKFVGQLLVINEFNVKMKVDQVVDRLKKAETGVLVSDAGMPAISDPGYVLIKKVIDEGGEVDVVPGPTAATTALVISGLSSDRVFFVGFLPKKKIKRDRIFEQIMALKQTTVIFYESVRRLDKFLSELEDKFDKDDHIVIAREMTKDHQQVIRGSLAQAREATKDKINPKGEIVVLFRRRSTKEK